MFKKLKQSLTSLRTWLISILAAGFSLLLILRAPVVATTMASLAIRDRLNLWIKDPYLRLIAAGCLTSLIFMVVMFNFSELAWAISSIGCYEAIDYWFTTS